MVSLVHECGGRSWKFCLEFLCTGAPLNVLLVAFPGKGDEALGILVLENCKVGITFTMCMRNGGVFPVTLCKSLQILNLLFESVVFFNDTHVVQWVIVDCWGLILWFLLTWLPKICPHQGKRAVLVPIGAKAPAGARDWETGFGGEIGQDKVTIFDVSQIL